MREKRLGLFQRLMIAVLATVFLGALFLSLFLSGLMARQMASANQHAVQIDSEKPHVFVQISNIDSSFRDTFLTGAKRAAADNGMELEIAGGGSGAEQYASILEAAIDAHVDGIILQPAWREAITPTVLRAAEKGIPFITVEEDMPASNRSCYVGINSFEFGTLAAKLAREAAMEQTSMAVVYRGLNQDNDTESSLKLSGLRDIIAQKANMSLVRVEQGTNAFFGAEDTIRDILTENPEVNVLACMTARDTVAAAQMVLDLNRLRYVQIIGTDLTPEIQDLLDKRVLYGTIARNPDAIGYKSVEAMSRVLAGEPVPDFIDVGLETVRSAK